MQPSVLLACFRNQQTDKAFTVAQLLYVDSEGDAKKVYCFAGDERSIAMDFGDLKGIEGIREQLRRRGLRATTSYTEYHSWFAKETGVQAKAMDMFNQTVAVKDIQKLNAFIRDHMLEAKPWAKRVDSLLNHFMQLSEAHKSLVEARKQRASWIPSRRRAISIASADWNWRESGNCSKHLTHSFVIKQSSYSCPNVRRAALSWRRYGNESSKPIGTLPRCKRNVGGC